MLPFVILHINDHICKFIFCSECRLMGLVCIIGDVRGLSVDGYFIFNQRNSIDSIIFIICSGIKEEYLSATVETSIWYALFLSLFIVQISTTLRLIPPSSETKLAADAGLPSIISKSRTFNQSMISTRIKRKMAQSPILKTSKIYIPL